VANGTSRLPTEKTNRGANGKSEGTVKRHIAHMCEKLDVATLQELAVEIVRRYILLSIAAMLTCAGIYETLGQRCPLLAALLRLARHA